MDFQTSIKPMLHEVLPSLQHMMCELSRIEHGDIVHYENKRTTRPSLYSMRLCGLMKEELREVEIHDLWLVACFLYPYLRDMSFWDDDIEREEFKRRAETLTRAMYAAQEADGETPSQLNGIVLGANTTRDANADSLSNEPPHKRRKFSLRDHVSRADMSFKDSDEVTMYKSIPLRQMGIEQIKFLENPFAVVQFWYNRRHAFPRLYKIAMRVYSTPASSSSSERVFSIVKKIVTPERSLLTPETICRIVVTRSLMQYNTSARNSNS